MVQPTDEQQKAVEKFRTGRPLKIAAFAGSGKTSTLILLAKTKRSRGLYLAFNKSIATEATSRFPRNVECRTTHSIAFRAVMPGYQSQPKLTDALHPKRLSEVAAYHTIVFRNTIKLTGVQQAHLVLQTIRRFCQSADPAVSNNHVPQYGRLLGAAPEIQAEVRDWAALEATKLWKRMIARGDDVPMGHDGYLKLWALGNPRLPADFILLDEAQDTNQVVLGVLQAQASQMVYVGDKHQQIYEWRGAINAMEQVKGCEETPLTQSFRFGETIAASASRVIATLGEKHRLCGNPAVQSSIAASGRTQAVLSRTNASVIIEVLGANDDGLRPHIVGGTSELERLLSDVFDLKDGKPGSTPEFFGFADWDEVVEFSETEEGEGIKTFVQLVEQHGERKLWSAVKSVARDERNADIILSTAHKAKGREWDSVRLSDDFVSPREGPESAAEVRLFYVAMTRAKKLLCVDPETVQHFSSDAWKASKDSKKKQSTPPMPSAPSRPVPAQRPVPRPASATPQQQARVQAAPQARPAQPVPPLPPRAMPQAPPAKPVSFWKKLFGG